MKKTGKILARITAFIFIGAILFFTNAFVGNPISKYIAKKEIEEYMDKEYQDLNLELVEVGYNFKNANYYGLLQSKTSEDTHFYVRTGHGEAPHDDYSFMVKGLENTIQRFEREHGQMARDI